jgi:hypothetical protein
MFRTKKAAVHDRRFFFLQWMPAENNLPQA